ncbi:hypothetical protein AB0N65_11660 [Paenarthrobacter sp. NPDC089322]|uniref:hypothetical protein n=1 Tax=Paenarthrobacter sp. NPDC089322 TaxID=3155065 RepID=UPI003422889D
MVLLEVDVYPAEPFRKTPENSIVVSLPCEVFPVHVANVQVVFDVAYFTGDAAESPFIAH